MVSAIEIDSKKRTDEYALGCRIRAAVKTDDIIGRWAHKMGRRVQNDVRCHGALIQDAISWLQDKYPDPGADPQDKEDGPFRTACGIYGAAAATAAR
eukprot:222453-Pyramimonas_sp.AAC.1